MQIDLIGHASLFIETQDCRILMDPVLWDPFCEGLNESCPQRQVHPEALPEFDFLVISHRHLDHFDIRSLAYLPKTVDVLIPRDRLIEDCLRQLGYSRIYPLMDFMTVRLGSTSLMTTRSEVRVPEFGLVVADDSGVFWNTVDTLFAPATIQKVRSTFPEIDFLLTTWHISMEGKYQHNQSLSFPFQLYGYLFNLLSLIAPKAIAPGAQGFKYIGASAWQNQAVFPVTREQFCRDLHSVFPALQQTIFQINPGDRLSFDQGEYRHEQAGSRYAELISDDRELLDFAPVLVGNPLVDANPEGRSIPEMNQRIEAELCGALPQFLAEHQTTLFREHCHWQVIYQLKVIFPEQEQVWHIDFSEEHLQVKPGRSPVANLFTYITASTLYRLILKQCDWDYLICSGEYRTFHRIYQMTQWGIVAAEEATIADPLHLKFSSSYVADQNIYAEVARWGSSPSVPPDPEDYMLQLGQVLIKRRKKQPNISSC
jgi:UDP-MurNAc hydroxylase